MSDPKTTPGGNAMKFYASVRLRLLGKKMIEIDEEVTKSKVSIGAHVTVRTDKCKLGPPKRAVDFQLLFTEGIYEYDEWITYLENLGYIVKGGGWYTFQEKFPLKSAIGTKFQKNNFEEVLEDAELHDAIRKVIIQAFIRPTNDAQLKLEQSQAEAIIE
jgi:recombination protein RecA